MSEPYAPPLDQLLDLGEPTGSDWADYREMGLTPEHEPELLRMLHDPELNDADSDDPRVWAPLHAWRALSQVGTEKSIEPLLDLLADAEDDYTRTEVPRVLAALGPGIIEPVREFLAKPDDEPWARGAASEALVKLAEYHPELRETCVSIIAEALRRRAQQDPILNAVLVGGLVDLKAVEELDLIREAYREGQVDLTFLGDFQDVEMELGLREKRTGSPRWRHEYAFTGGTGAPTTTEADFRRAGRNDPCPCGSGIKYKKCCLNRKAA